MKTNTKTHQVVMLPTTKSNNIGDIVLSPDSTRLATINVLTVDSKQPCTNQHLYIIVDRKEDDESTWIKEGDWYVSDNGLEQSTILQAKKEYEGFYKGKQTCKKIVATTDKSLKIVIGDSGWKSHDDGGWSEYKPEYKLLPQIPESFIQDYIKAYNEGKPITEVDLEMEIDYVANATPPTKPMDSTVYKIKTRPDNTVIIHIKEDRLYTKGEVENYLRKMYYEATGQSTGHPDGFCDKWIKNNL